MAMADLQCHWRISQDHSNLAQLYFISCVAKTGVAKLHSDIGLSRHSEK
ncbi:hypothetical protein BS78_K101900 [Paspalum vaginatum]|uniref:Uncharacterized protein n=1 Tax=Paspalum vaginatum TaxID=158149 RepID=A0A9W7X6Q2_9POAL|nr:hypothetical protein BS78_K101900 [Paspalum vaginatum]